MPIRPELKPLYPPDWKQISEARKEAANWQCERCKAAHWRPYTRRRPKGIYAAPDRHNRYQLIEAEIEDLTDTEASHLSRIVLTTAHLDHNPANCESANLAVLCQACHLQHDRPHHALVRGKRKDRDRPILRYIAELSNLENTQP